MRRAREDGIGFDELGQAARNHGMPLEALRADLTPAGMHYVLVHYDVPFVDPASHTVSFDGFDRPLEVGLGDLRARSAVTVTITFECAGNGRALFETRAVSQPWLHEAVGTGEWTGTPLGPLLREAGPPHDALEVLFTGLDRGIEGEQEQAYERSLPLAEAMREDVLLVYEMNGQPLLPQHGAPVRLIVPGWYGMANVKWLSHITALTEPHRGHQNAVAYRMRATDDEDGRPVTRILVRSLMAPPGIPSFPERERVLAPGPVRLEGRAWSGSGPIERVEVSVDGCVSWDEARVEPSPSPSAWHRWTFAWTATPGVHEIASRATDATGATQPMEPAFNLGGYENNAVHRVKVTVTQG
jgi:sulfane dehydrogenase subunit SoxC